MHGFSTVDGFINVKEGVDEMIKHLANEPSVGLFFVQHHAHSSMPYLLNVKEKVVEKIHEVILHIEDIEDSICVVRSMTECGLPIADEMIKDINKSLLVMSVSQPKKGLIRNPTWGFQAGKGSSSTPAALDYSAVNGQQDGGSSRSYLSSVFNSAKQKAAGFRWSQPDFMPKGPEGEQFVPSTVQAPSTTDSDNLSTRTDAETDELPVSSNLADANQVQSTLVEKEGEPDATDGTSHDPDEASLLPLLEAYDKFRSEREAKLEEWLQEQPQEKRG